MKKAINSSLHFLLYKGIIKALKYFPKSLRETITNSIVALRARKAKSLKTPTSIVFFITNKCNARCIHCFYWKELNTPEKEMNIPEIRKIAHSLKDSYSIVITGGEPFLRKDIYDICKSFNGKISTLRLATNGLKTSFIHETVSKMLKHCSFRQIDIQISIDGPEELHDHIRGVKGCYNSAIETIKRLKALKSIHSRTKLNIEIITALNKKNHNKIKAIASNASQLRTPVNFIITRSSSYGVFNLPKIASSEIYPKEKNITDLSSEELKNIFSELKAINSSQPYKFWNIENQLYLKYSIELLEKRKKRFDCYAGTVDGVIYPNGEVALCELTKPIGNLKNYNFNLYSLWHSKKANEMRKNIRQCSCIHSCNMSTNIRLSKEYINATQT
tara:strand:- start:831 stop:1994 length:1164 start_codon:yes stop_codon:yes gene_type:complete